MGKQKKQLTKENCGWVQNFILIGKAQVNDYTFKIDQHSQNSDWIYNALNLGVNCGDNYGTIFCELMGGYGSGRDNFIYVRGKEADSESYTIDWDDRFDEDILKDISDMSFMQIALERDAQGKPFYKKFLSPYDVIAYVKEHLKPDTVIAVKGRLKYTIYNDELQVRKEITSIALPKSEIDPSQFRATFTQTVLLDKTSIGKADNEKSIIPITGYVLEKFREYNGKDLTEDGKVKGGKLVPLRKTFEFEFDINNEKQTKLRLEKMFKVSKNITLATFEGKLIEGGAVINATEDDLDDDIKELIELGFYTLEEVLSKFADNKSKERRMVIVKPYVKSIEQTDGSKKLEQQKFDNFYTEEDLILDYLMVNEDEEEDEVPFDEVDELIDDLDDSSWLDDLG